MLQIQLDLFRTPEECELITLRSEFKKLHESTEKVRKGTYAKIGEIRKEVDDIKHRFEVIERNICKGMS